jgi:hypothetical protein
LRSILVRLTVGAVGAVALGVAVLASAAAIAVSLVGERQRPLAVLDSAASQASEAPGGERAAPGLAPRADGQDGAGAPEQGVSGSSGSGMPAESENSATAGLTAPDRPTPWLRSFTTRGATTLVHVALEGLEPGEDLKSVWRSEVTAKMLGETTLVTIWEPEESDLRVTSIGEPGESEIRFVLRHLQLVLATLVDLRELREGRR